MAGSWNTTQIFELPAASSSETAIDTTRLNLELFEKLLPSTIFFTIWICLGIPGNLLVILVYFNRFKASSTRVFVLAMAACDIFVCLAAAPVHVIYFRFMYTVSNSLCRVMFLLLKFPIYVSGLILVCASLDRRHRICQPLKRQLSARQATYVLVVPLGLAILATFPFTAFKGKVKFTTVTGLSVMKCGFHFESEFSETVVTAVEGGVLSVCCITGLALIIWAYSHIAYRVRLQSRRKRENFAQCSAGSGTVACTLAAPQALASRPETSQDACDTAEERNESRDRESLDERVDACSSEQQVQDSKPQTREATKEGRQPTGRLQGSRKSLASKTTLVMFVLTSTNCVCLLPYVIWTQFHETYYEPHLSSWTMNMVTTSNYLPSARSTISPLIYICFNPKFRQQCRQFLISVVTSRI